MLDYLTHTRNHLASTQKSIAKSNNLCTSQFQKGDGANLFIHTFSILQRHRALERMRRHRALGHDTHRALAGYQSSMPS